VVSLIAMVPESEWRIPTLMVSWAFAGNTARPKASPAVAISHRRVIGLVWRIEHPSALTRAFKAPAGVHAHVTFRKQRANREMQCKLLSHQADSAGFACLPNRQSFSTV
jgi:hypothetical protein